MRGMYKHITAGKPLPEALALSIRETASSSNFVCMGADPTPQAAVGAGDASTEPTAAAPSEEPANAPSKGTAPCAGSASLHAHASRPQPTVPFQWGAPPGV